MFCFLIYELFLLFIINTNLDIDFNIYEFDFYKKKKILLFCFIIYILFLLFIINIRLNVDFIIFDIELIILILKNINIKSHVISFKKKKFVIV